MYFLHLDVKFFKLKAGEWRNNAIKAAIRWRKPTGVVKLLRRIPEGATRSGEAALAHARSRATARL
jgi:hypothetical protein